LFGQILTIAHTMGVCKLGAISLDGTKVKANASKHKALSWEHACKLEKQIHAEVDALLRQAEEADKGDPPDGMSIPDELARREERLETIARATTEIQRRASERYTEEKEAYDQKMAERTVKEQENGKKPRGREPKPPEPGPKTTDQVNLTDEDSRIMPTSGGGFEQTYNAQAGVDMGSMHIVENHVTQQPNDKQEIKPALENLAALPDTLGKVDALAADTGYFSENNVKRCEQEHTKPYIATKGDKHNQSLNKRFYQSQQPLPENADPVTTMKHRLKTLEGKKLYSKRKSTVETVFGIIKAVIGFRQFLLRGLESVSGEWDLVCIAYNLKRLHVLTT